MKQLPMIEPCDFLFFKDKEANANLTEKNSKG